MASNVLSMGKTALEITAPFVPIPALVPAVDLLLGLVKLFENVTTNRHSAHQLCQRCKTLIESVSESVSIWPEDRVSHAIRSAHQMLYNIYHRIHNWLNKNRVLLFYKQTQFEEEISKAKDDVDRCLEALQLTALVDTNRWQHDIQEAQQRDHEEVILYLSESRSMQTVIHQAQIAQGEKLQEHGELLKQVMGMMQQALPTFGEGDRRYRGLQRNLYHLQLRTGSLLPNLELQPGIVRRVGRFAAGGSSETDIWEGMYLDEEKVAIKMIRPVAKSERNFQRFMREIDVWSRLWEVDRGQHTLPLYGWCQSDGPYPYVVSPWQSNGTVNTYMQKPGVNLRRLLVSIARGVRVLHTMNPPICHGDLRGDNILVSATGNPIIANFGWAKLIEEITGTPFTATKGVTEVCRWMAGELFEDGMEVMSTRSDIWSLGMTILELMTGTRPFAHIKHNTQVIVAVHKDDRPRRPEYPAIIQKGFNGRLWNLLQRCWRRDPYQRPDIDEVIAELELWWAEIDQLVP